MDLTAHEVQNTDALEQTISDAIEAEREARGHTSRVDYPHAYASEAHKCSRQIALRVAEVDRSNEIDTKGRFAAWQGTAIHRLIQGAMEFKYDNLEFEKPFELPKHPVTGYADIVGTNVVGDIKTMHGYAFDLAVHGKRGRPAEGPKMEHVIQAAIGAEALGRASIRIIYWNKAAQSNSDLSAQWTVPYDMGLRQEVSNELTRMGRIVEGVESKQLPARVYNGEVITDPGGTKWPCTYCGWQDICIKLPDEQVDLGEVTNGSPR